MAFQDNERTSEWLGRDYLDALLEARRAGKAPFRILVSRPPFDGLASGRLMVIAVRRLYAHTDRDTESSEAFNSDSPLFEWVLAYSHFERAPRRPRTKR